MSAMADDRLGKLLRDARRANGLTLRDVEERTGVSNAYLSQLEHGRIRQPSPVVLHQLSDAYKLPYEDLLDSAGYPVPEAVKSRVPSTDSPLRRFGKISRDEETALADYLAFLRTKRKAEGR